MRKRVCVRENKHIRTKGTICLELALFLSALQMQVKTDTVLTELLITQKGKRRKSFFAVPLPCQRPTCGIALHGNQIDAFLMTRQAEYV